MVTIVRDKHVRESDPRIRITTLRRLEALATLVYVYV